MPRWALPPRAAWDELGALVAARECPEKLEGSKWVSLRLDGCMHLAAFRQAVAVLGRDRWGKRAKPLTECIMCMDSTMHRYMYIYSLFFKTLYMHFLHTYATFLRRVVPSIQGYERPPMKLPPYQGIPYLQVGFLTRSTEREPENEVAMR